ncbi:HAD-like domain-containing protein [Triangularia verruculosa]|uniref:HAD-like domain-containing protein n=1 Tax=Triangularia verruculosa TaxID=2587418 RepID=A0AAN7AVI7_9PEZI|nr:HAD-like domain-containing protein [Triangularia verruculosa]
MGALSLRLFTRPGVVGCRSLSRSSTVATAALINKRSPSLLRPPPPSLVATRGLKDETFSKEASTLGKRWIRPDAPSPSEWEAPSFAFAFDIDGVLLHEREPLEGAAQVLALLDHYHIPFILLTNGGGKFERDRVAELNQKLHSNMTTDNFCQSHTPFQELLPEYADKTILVTGSDYEKCRQIMQGYGFRSVVTPGDIFTAKPEVFPFETVGKEMGKPLPKPLWTPPKVVEGETVKGKVLSAEEAEKEEEEKRLGEHLKIDAMFVLNDPRDWALDVQVFMDLLQSKQGYVGTYSEENNRGNWQGDGQPKLFFSNSDLIWAAKYHLPRFGQGAFQHALVGIWKEVTEGKAELKRTSFGKPHRETYEYAEEMLVRHREEWLKSKGYPQKVVRQGLKRVYMVGDNPESDIAGANDYDGKGKYGTEWVSLLVETGVYNELRMNFKEGDVRKADVVRKNVAEAIKWALMNEGWKVE